MARGKTLEMWSLSIRVTFLVKSVYLKGQSVSELHEIKLAGWILPKHSNNLTLTYTPTPCYVIWKIRD